ncbi:MAG: deoxyribonuclease IV [bacterium]
MINPIGAHFSIKNGYLGAFKEALETGADALQIFAKSPASAKLRLVTNEESISVKKWANRDKIRALIIHSSYLINLAKEEYSEDSFAIKTIIEDLNNSELLGGIGTVVHFGKSLDVPENHALSNYVKNIGLIVEKTPNLKSKILIENTAGQGTEMGYDLEKLSKTFHEINNNERVRVCVDLAHAFGAGYDLSKEDEAKNIANKLKDLFGINNVACIHFNDSKKPLGSHVDRHEDIGFGQINEEGLKSFAIELSKIGGNNIPLILETPQDNASYTEQIRKIKDWL